MIPRPPIIIIGMHRSGTSMITRMLEELGLYIGKKREHNHEALFFLRLNQWILHHNGAGWDHPEPIDNLLNDRDVRALTTDYLEHLMHSPHAAGYLGWGKYLRYRSITRLPFPWGWKDPRNTFTLPLWMDIFPEAKVLHIHRHGVDVANSLMVREEQILTQAKMLHAKRKKFHLYWLRKKRVGFKNSWPCTSLSGGFHLWESYLKRAQEHVSRLGDQAMELKYEDFLADPVQALERLVQFCNLEVDGAAVVQVAGTVKKSRAYAYQQDATLQSFADEVRERLALMGY